MFKKEQKATGNTKIYQKFSYEIVTTKMFSILLQNILKQQKPIHKEEEVKDTWERGKKENRGENP